MTTVEILDKLGIPYDNSGRGKNRNNWTNVLCPFCGRNPYLGIPEGGRVCNCWNCSTHPLWEAISLLAGISEREAKSLLRDLPNYEPVARKEHTGKLILPNDVGPLRKAHENYIRSRGLNPREIVHLWGVRGIGPLGGGLAWRLWIPCMVNGEIVSWTTRKITPGEPRYVDAKPDQSRIPLKSCVYGLDNITNGTCIIVEGPVDVWHFGFGAVCLFGNQTSPGQIECLSRIPVRIICLDSGKGEEVAQSKSLRLCHQLSVFGGRTIRVTLTSGKDFARCDPTEIQDIKRRYFQ
jgi:hypothetical protein